MTRNLTLIALMALTLSACGGPRGPIRSACVASERARATPAMCACIQSVADSDLSSSEQRQAARFFKDPDKAQDTRQNGDSSFWRRYRAFATKAERRCG